MQHLANVFELSEKWAAGIRKWSTILHKNSLVLILFSSSRKENQLSETKIEFLLQSNKNFGNIYKVLEHMFPTLYGNYCN